MAATIALHHRQLLLPANRLRAAGIDRWAFWSTLLCALRYRSRSLHSCRPERGLVSEQQCWTLQARYERRPDAAYWQQQRCCHRGKDVSMSNRKQC